jgi:hypothetical protein
MKPKILIVYKDFDNFKDILQCIKNRYGEVINRFSLVNPPQYIMTEHIEFYCVSINTNFSFFRGRRYDDIYISRKSRELITDDIRELLFYGLHDLEYYQLAIGVEKNE